MPTPLTREDLEFYAKPLQEGIEQINLHLKELNSKTNKNITDIAILYDRAQQAKQLAHQSVETAKTLALGVVEDAKNAGKTNGGKWGAGLGSAVATAVILIWQWLQKN